MLSNPAILHAIVPADLQSVPFLLGLIWIVAVWNCLIHEATCCVCQVQQVHTALLLYWPFPVSRSLQQLYIRSVSELKEPIFVSNWSILHARVFYIHVESILFSAVMHKLLTRTLRRLVCWPIEQTAKTLARNQWISRTLGTCIKATTYCIFPIYALTPWQMSNR